MIADYAKSWLLLKRYDVMTLLTMLVWVGYTKHAFNNALIFSGSKTVIIKPINKHGSELFYHRSSRLKSHPNLFSAKYKNPLFLSIL